MHIELFRRVMKIPVLGEVLGAVSGCAIALLAYGVYMFIRELLGA